MPRRAEAPGRVRARGIELARLDAQVTPGPKGGGHPTAHCASPARVPGAAALSRTGNVRPRDVHRARRRRRHGPARAGGRLRLDRSRRARGRLVAVRDPGRGGETVVRLLVERDGHRILRALDERCPERTVDAGNETDIRVVEFMALGSALVRAHRPSACSEARRAVRRVTAVLAFRGHRSGLCGVPAQSGAGTQSPAVAVGERQRRVRRQQAPSVGEGQPVAERVPMNASPTRATTP